MYELYALGALEAADRAALAAHLAHGCPRCTPAEAEARNLVAQLACLSSGILPPAGLREKILRFSKS